LIGVEQKYEVAIDPYFDTVELEWLGQKDESDMKLLKRLARENDAVFKAMGQRIVFIRKGKDMAETFRKAFGSFQIANDDNLLSYRFTLEDESPYDGVKAKWRDEGAAETKHLQVGPDDAQKLKRLRGLFSNEAEAKAAAEAEYKRLKRLAVTGSISLVGRPDLLAEAELTLTGWRDEVCNGVYTITSVVTTVSKTRGFTTDLDFELLI
jgi:phage protein D